MGRLPVVESVVEGLSRSSNSSIRKNPSQPESMCLKVLGKHKIARSQTVPLEVLRSAFIIESLHQVFGIVVCSSECTGAAGTATTFSPSTLHATKRMNMHRHGTFSEPPIILS